MSRHLPPLARRLSLLTLFLTLAAGVGPSSGSGLGATLTAGVPPPGGGPAGAPHGNATTAATAAPRPAVKDVGFGLGPSGYGRGGFESVLAAVFNKVAKGTTATPMTTKPPPMAPSTTPAPTTTRAPPTTMRLPTLPPLPTELIPLPPPPPPAGAGGGGATPTRRAPHPHPDYAPPNRPPPLPAEYNPFANKAILRGSQSEVGSAGPGRKPHPQLLPPRPPMDELIPLRPVNTPSQGGGKGADALPAIPEAPRPDRPPERPGSAGKHHLDGHIHTVASGPAPAPALTPIGHHQGGLGQGHGHGHGHGHGAGHNGDHSLKAAKPTELLEQVNKDSIIDVHQAEVAVVADPAIHRDEDNMKEVLMVPATSPPSSVVRPGGMAGGGRGGPVAGMGAGGEWHLAWTAQVYGLGTMWGVLAALCLVAAVFVDSRTRLVPRVHFTMLLALLLALAAANAVSLFYDVINHDQLQQQQHRPRDGAAGAPASASESSSVGAEREAAVGTRVPQLLADLTLPFLPAAFSVFFFVVLRVNHIPCGNSGVPQTPAFLVLLFLFLATTMSLEVASCAVAAVPDGDGAGGNGLRAGARGLTVTVAALLGLAYMVVYRPLRRAAAKKQAEQLRAAYTAFRRLPTPALPRVVNALLVCALLLVALATMASYRLMDTTLMGGNTDWRLPPWWYMRLAEHVGSLLVGFLLLWCATRGPSRSSDERSTASRSSRGTPGALSLVSCTGRRFLFDCPSTGSEENKTSEDNTYPAVCASNHAILNYTQHTGNKLYDDSFPLANLHSAPPLNSSGDDFCSVPTMPKRASRASTGSSGGVSKAGTLLPYSKASRRAAAPGPGHHTLGPGGQLYDGDVGRDTLRRGARTTGRTRKPRHARHQQEVYSNCPQDDEYDYDQRVDQRADQRVDQRVDQRIDLDGLADDFTVFKQYASTGSSESADNYDVPMLVGAPAAEVTANNKRHRRRDRGGGSDRDDPRAVHHHRKAARHANGAAPAALAAPADSLSPASPSDLSDCDRLSSNRSSYDEGAPMAVRTQPQQHHHGHLNHHHQQQHRGKPSKQQVLLYDASEDDVTPDSAVVADISASPRGHHSPREKRPGVKRLGRRHQQHQQHLSQETPSSPELHDNVWSPQ